MNIVKFTNIIKCPTCQNKIKITDSRTACNFCGDIRWIFEHDKHVPAPRPKTLILDDGAGIETFTKEGYFWSKESEPCLIMYPCISNKKDFFVLKNQAIYIDYNPNISPLKKIEMYFKFKNFR